MTRTNIYVWLFFLAGMLVSCASSSKRKTADYYHQHEVSIKEIMQLYDQLYEQQPFSAGFSDRSFKYYLMEVRTDTVRYIYNTEKNKEAFYSTIFRFNYDTVKLKSLGEKIRDIKCLWLSKSTFYISDKPETVNFLSFKSVSSGKLFVENKYYILVFLKHPISSPDINARIEKGDLVKINDLVYYMIGSGFR